MIILTSDHAGYEIKEKIKTFLTKEGISYIDNGPHNKQLTDYPDYAKSASNLVLEDPNNKGVFICGTGIGMSIAANKIKGIRAAAVYDKKTTELAIEHNNANVITFGARYISFRKVKKIIKALVNSSFEKGRHATRVNKITSLEN